MESERKCERPWWRITRGFPCCSEESTVGRAPLPPGLEALVGLLRGIFYQPDVGREMPNELDPFKCYMFSQQRIKENHGFLHFVMVPKRNSPKPNFMTPGEMSLVQTRQRGPSSHLNKLLPHGPKVLTVMTGTLQALKPPVHQTLTRGETEGRPGGTETLLGTVFTVLRALVCV